MNTRRLAVAILILAANGSSFAGPALSSIYSFGFTNSAAANPYAALVQGSDGLLYGTTSAGGPFAQGTVFRVNLDGAGFTLLKSFGSGATDGLRPLAALIVGTNGALYGTTEAGPSIFEEHPRGLPRPLLSIGYPLPQIEVRLVGGATADEGVLQVRSPAMFSEYLNLPDVTRDRLREGWYDTGDVMRRDANGFFYFAGRADDMFVCGGENVFPGEIEKMLERHPAVMQAAVVPVPDEVKGEIPIAFVVLKDGGVSAEELKRFALANGPAFSHPRAFVTVDELPVASTHKLDKRPLRPKALEVARALKR